MEHDTNTRLLGTALIVTVCILCRQLGLVLPAAFAACFVARYGMTGVDCPRSGAAGCRVRGISRLPVVGGIGGLPRASRLEPRQALTDLIQADAARAFALRTAGVGLCLGLFVLPFA